MAKVAIKSEKLTPFGGIFSIMEQFDSRLSSVIDSTLGMRCRLYGYQYSEIIRSLMSVYFCGGSCIEDVTTHLMSHLSLHPTLRTCSADTILRAIKELTMDNISYTSDTGKTYDFNTADKLNTLLLNCLLSTGQLQTKGTVLLVYFWQTKGTVLLVYLWHMYGAHTVCKPKVTMFAVEMWFGAGDGVECGRSTGLCPCRWAFPGVLFMIKKMLERNFW